MSCPALPYGLLLLDKQTLAGLQVDHAQLAFLTNHIDFVTPKGENSRTKPSTRLYDCTFNVQKAQQYRVLPRECTRSFTTLHLCTRQALPSPNDGWLQNHTSDCGAERQRWRLPTHLLRSFPSGLMSEFIYSDGSQRVGTIAPSVSLAQRARYTMHTQMECWPLLS